MKSLILFLLCALSTSMTQAQMIAQNLIAAPDGWEFGNALASSGSTLAVGDSAWLDINSNPVGTVYLYTITNGQGTLQAQLTANDAQPFDQFGYSLALSATTLVVGATRHNGCGTVYVYTLLKGAWKMQQEIVPVDGQIGDRFGCAVSLSSTTLAIGASHRGSGASGAVYTYTLTKGVWTPQAEWLDPDAANTYAQFGSSLSLNGPTLAIGAPGSNVGSGAVYVYAYVSGGWKRQITLTGGGAANADFGYAVVLTSSLLAVGAPGISAVTLYSSANGYASPQATFAPFEGSSVTGFGHAIAISGNSLAVSAVNSDDVAAYVFTQSKGTWAQAQEFTPSDSLQQSNTHFGAAVAFAGGSVAVARPTAWYSAFAPGSVLGEVCCYTLGGAEGGQSGGQYGNGAGYAVAVAGTTVLAGAPGWNMNRGHVSVRTVKLSSLPQQTVLTAANGQVGDGFGFSLAFDGTTLVVGAPYANNGAGGVYLYTVNAGVWSFTTELTASDGQTGDLFGNAVGLSNGLIVIGAPGKNDGTGAAYVYALSATTWSQQAELTTANGQSGDGFGTSVGISGATVVVGAPNADTALSQFAGTAYVFTQSGSQWTQATQLAALDGQFGDQFGAAVALVGSQVAIGAPSGGLSPGAVYVYASNAGSWAQTAELSGPDANSQFGAAVALSTTTLAVGAYNQYNQNGSAGQVFTFTPSSSGSWLPFSVLSAEDGQTYDNFGAAVALSGSSIAIGAPYANGGSGALYAY